MSVRDVQLDQIAGLSASEIKAGARTEDAIDWALSEPHTVMTMWAPENGLPPRPEVWTDVRIHTEEHGLFRALVAECRLESGELPSVETMIARARARLGLAPACATTPKPGWPLLSSDPTFIASHVLPRVIVRANLYSDHALVASSET